MENKSRKVQELRGTRKIKKTGGERRNKERSRKREK
jgi:hypothetical protein